MIKLSFLPALFLISSKLFSATYFVGSSHTYTNPRALYDANIIQANDIILIEAETFTGNAALAVWNKDNLTIKGINGKPKLIADGKYIFGKGIWVISGNNCSVENIEFSGATVPDQNGAGIRLDGSGIKITKCYFHHNENGMLITSNTPGDVLIEHSEFAYNGYGDGQSHNIYVNNTNSFTFRYNYTHHAMIGHCIKSRAKINTIEYNRIMDEDGNSSRLIDLPNGGICVINGNVMHQGKNAENFNAIGIGLEGLTSGIDHIVSFNHNTILNERTASCLFLQINQEIKWSEGFFLTNNIFGGLCKTIDSSFDAELTEQANLIKNEISDLKLKDPQNYDYHLTNESPGIDAATNPVALPYAFVPEYQYKYDTDFEVRSKHNGNFDMGAFEYVSPNGVIEGTNNKSIFFPNPVKDMLYFNEGVESYIIYDVKGRVVKAGRTKGRYLNVESVSAGMYYIKVNNNKIERLIKI